MLVVDLDVSLPDLPYPVTRKLTLPLAIRLTDLHLVLQAAMGWDNSHLYDFACGKGRTMHRWADLGGMWEPGEYDHQLKSGTLAEILALMGKQKNVLYTYDMGDSWEHGLRPSPPREAEFAIALLAATGACPPEDTGGVPGFSYILECLDDPTSPDRAEYVEWMGEEPFDRSADLAALTARVARVAKKLAKRYAA